VAYSADGWAFTLGADKIGGGNLAWVEVTFRNASGNILSLYRSAIMNNTMTPNTWTDLAVTNQYDPNTFALIGPVSTLVAPAGTSFVRYQIVFQGDAANSGGSMYFDDLTLTQLSANAYGDWNIVWSDEFDGVSINPANWTYEVGDGSAQGIPGWGNNELEYYTSNSSTSFVSNGLLHIVALRQAVGGKNYTSARMKSQSLVARTYGRFEFRAKLPQGVGFWPALWMFPNDSVYGGWPASGEIDIMENKGSQLSTVQGTIHFGNSGTDSFQTATFNLPNGGSVTNFHTYLCEWSTNAIYWYVDGLRYETQTGWFSASNPYPAPFNQNFFMIMNLAVGGNYLGNPAQTNINANSTFPGDMQVDYVRIYDNTGPLALSITQTNSSVVLSWPANIVSHLQAQTNTPDGIIGTWTDVPGAPNPMIITPDTNNVFYRLRSP
jgi:beta-glucanase (GH16 family)